MNTPRIRHSNNGDCPKCDELFNRYKGFHYGLRLWFKYLQSMRHDAHISDAGRGKHRQEQYFKDGSSKALWGESAHNFNAALDIFCMEDGWMTSYDKEWFDDVVGTAVDDHNQSEASEFQIVWYGKRAASYYELPHCQVKNWRILNLDPVEPIECVTSPKTLSNSEKSESSKRVKGLHFMTSK